MNAWYVGGGLSCSTGAARVLETRGYLRRIQPRSGRRVGAALQYRQRDVGDGHEANDTSVPTHIPFLE